MSGKCYSCATGFGFFKKELGCKNCGFAFCKDCLTKKAAVPKRKNEVHKVCNSCYDILTGKVDPAAKKVSYSPPAAYKKRMEALNNPQPTKQPVQQTRQPKKFYPKTMTKEDIAIAERLEKLKESRKPVNLPDDKEIRRKLDNLNQPTPPAQAGYKMPPVGTAGQPPSDNTQNQMPPAGQAHIPPSLQPEVPPANQSHMPFSAATSSGAGGGPPGRVDEVHRLMTRYTELVNIDQKYQPNNGVPGQSPQQQQGNVVPGMHGDPLLNAAKLQDMSGKPDEVNALIEAMGREAELDTQRAAIGDTKDTELRTRLNALKGVDPNVTPASQYAMMEGGDEEEESEEVAAEKALKRILENTHTDEKNDIADMDDAQNAISQLEEAPDSDPEDQLPWCCICNSDATLRCYGCDGDLYCKRCYREGHDQADYEDHQTKKFVSKKVT